MPTRTYLTCVCSLLLVCAPRLVQAADPPECRVQLTDVTASTGIAFRHSTGGSGLGYIVEGMASGLALFDYDGDDLIDIYFLNGAPLKGTSTDEPLRNALYRNNGDWTFTEVTDVAGVGDAGYGLGVVAADYDNDGDQDLYVSNFGANVLYRNNGDRTFTDVTREAGVVNGEQVGAGAAFFDMDADGDLDLYAANYVNFTYDNHVPIVIEGEYFQAGPQYYEPVPDSLFENIGGGRFRDVSATSGVGAVAGPGMGVVCGDWDRDGDQDIYVCNDGTANFLFQNDGRGRFREQGLLAGVAYDFYGKKNSSMGVDCGDYDGDGLLDLFVTNYQSEMPVLYRNLGQGFFEDATSSATVTQNLFPHVHWGTGFVDFDLDGDRDLFVACGHFDRVETIDDRTALRVPNFLLLNDGRGRFSDVSKRCGDGLAVIESSRGAAFDDLDNDGDIDVVVLNSNGPPTLLRNDTLHTNNWLQVQLQGTRSNRDGIGAEVRLITGTTEQAAVVHGGRGYQSHWGTRLHFGIPAEHPLDRLEVRWPSGFAETHPLQHPGRRWRLVEGEGTR